jgi:uncharacterized protein (TIGR02145 family)
MFHIKGMRYSLLHIFCIVLPVILMPLAALPEGTEQIMLSPTGHGKIQVMPGFNEFAWYDASGTSAGVDYRLYIHIGAVGEKIHYGFGNPLNNVDLFVTDCQYRIKDPAGNIVVGPSPIPLSGTGHISTWDQAVAGPQIIAGGTGYPQLTYNPSMTGDYFIEFNFDNGFFGNDRCKFMFFDVTVGSAANNAIDGRLWSKAWQLTTDNYGFNFLGTMFVYADDGVVTSINFNGMDPFVFTVACNQYGCYNTGNFNLDRRSVTGNHINPQYKIFLNDPDITQYPTGTLGSVVPPVVITPSCTGTATIQIEVTQPGNVDILLNINPAPGFQSEDVQLTATVVAGVNMIPWNGLNGLGQPVVNGTIFDVIVTYINGLTNLPIYDVEANPNGFMVSLTRPTGPDPMTYWDDILVGGTQQFNGCSFVLPSTGCHSWNGGSSWGIGNNNTVNTWWYAVTSTEAPVVFTELRSPQPLGSITGTATLCNGTTNNIYWVHSEPNSTSYIWLYSGTGATITTVDDTTVSIDFATNATSGILSVSGNNAGCGAGPPSSLAITILPPSNVTLNPFNPVCIDSPPFTLTGGSPAGGTYFVDGIPSPTFDPQAAGAGIHQIAYQVTPPGQCFGADTVYITVNPLPVVTLAPLTSVCIDVPPFALTGGSPAGGNYSGPGVSGGIFTPSAAGAGTHTIAYTYTDANGCTNSDAKPITVYALPVVTLAPFNPVCINSAPFPLAGGSPPGGVYSGPGVIAGTFSPATAGVGTHTITYTYTDANGCVNFATNTITVNPLPGTPGIISGPNPVCQGTTGTLYTIGAIPDATSYSWSVIPVSAGVISGFSTTGTMNWDAAFTGPANIYVTGVNNCGNGPTSNAFPVTVNPNPVVSFPICTDTVTVTNAQPILLRGGMPLGGTYSGTGVSSGQFYPAIAGVGTHPVTYSYTNMYGCSRSAVRIFTVQNPPAFACNNNFRDIRDNRLYRTILIGSQCWMAENLNYGNTVASSLFQRDNCIPEKYCYSDNPINCSSSGGLYQWDEVMVYSPAAGAQGFCPPGWHLPTLSEWNILFSNYINNGFAGSPLKSTGYSGFNALLSGAGFFNKIFTFYNFATLFWTSDSHGPFKAWAHGMNTYNPSVSLYPGYRTNAFSVRCIRD